jgi:hypothetical protein
MVVMVYEFMFRNISVNGIEIEGDLWIAVNSIALYIQPPTETLLVTINNKVKEFTYHMVKLSNIKPKNPGDNKWLDEIKYEFLVLRDILKSKSENVW